MYVRVVGENTADPNIIAGLMHLARPTEVGGDVAEAVRLHREMFAMARRVYGTDVDDPSVATVLDNCAHALTASGDVV